GKIDLFVANDSTSNFYFVNQSDGRGGPLSFEEQAQALGVAVDRDGKPQACMGIACDDADGDGLLDLFVTNFYGESNTLYVQQPDELFVDNTRPAGLREPSLFMLGFGTQFLDAELDGLPDLVLTNGHVDDFRPEGIPYRMRPQYFRNAGKGRFEEVRSPSLGPYFSTELLGRGLTKLDWNRDGLEDFVVSHLLDDPVALVTNESPEVGRHLAVHLRGVRRARDAIGATVVVTAGDRTWTRQLTAGDGYMASNERRLVFGLGESETVDSLEIRWPGGGVQRFKGLAAGTELLFIEGRAAPHALAPPER
nr:CRTAC1 family protein [Planctomycetota bacterium]